MGAESFMNLVKASSAASAFEIAGDDARYDHGHAGYTGTIAEKHDFKICDTKGRSREQLFAAADDPEEWDAQGVYDKWGPAGCFELGDGEYLFFGLASS